MRTYQKGKITIPSASSPPAIPPTCTLLAAGWRMDLGESLLLPALCHSHKELGCGIQACWMQCISTSSQGQSCEERELGLLDPPAPRSICTHTQIALNDQMASYKTTCSHQQCSKHFLLETCFLSGTCRWFPSLTCKFSKIHLLNWLLCNLHMLRFDCEYLKLAIFLK